ncbi:MAG: universal stress protein [Azonexus sp.]|nr:universal stress protein [Azonexus sp.]
MKSETLRVLIALDGSPSSMAVARCWSTWASARVSLEATLLTVVGDTAGNMENALGIKPMVDAIASVQAWFVQSGLASECVVVEGGNPATRIIDEAQRRQVDLIAMGTRGLSPLRGLLLGSVAAQVTRSSPMPIWLMGPHAVTPAALGQRLRLLVAVDGSVHAAHAAAWAGAMVTRLGEASIELFSVQLAFSPFEGMLDAAAGDFRHWGQGVGEAAIAAARQFMGAAGHQATAAVATGDALPIILTHADEIGADVIVVAPQGVNALEQAVLGSVSQSLLQSARCPVLIVPRNLKIDDPD